jgi:putative hydrolase of the HAD superfamily
MTIDAVLFDLDGTLCEYRRSTPDLLESAFADVGVEPIFTAEDYISNFEDFSEPGITIAELRSNCFAALAERRGFDPQLGREVATAYDAERDHADVELLPGAAEALETLAEDHHLGLITNGGPDMQHQKIEALDLDRWLDATVFAGHDCAYKPDPEPFERALETLGSSPEHAVYVGNSLDSDVAGAHAAGVRSVWVPAEPGVEPEPEPHHSFETLHPLCERPWLK